MIEQDSTGTNATLWAEFLFILLPFFLVFLILAHKAGPGGIRALVFLPEWSIAAAVVTGQTMIKFVTKLLHVQVKSEGAVRLGAVELTIAILLCLLLAPSLIVLTLILMSESPQIHLAIMQLSLFIASILAFFGFGLLGQRLIERH